MSICRRAFTGLLAAATLSLIVAAAPASAAPALRAFCDVPAAAFYGPAVEWAKSAGITGGVSPLRFDGGGVTSRGQLVTLLHRYVAWRDGRVPDSSVPHPFVDVPPGAFYEQAVRWASADEITTGVALGRFDPDAATSRGQLAAFIHRLAQRPEVAGPGPFVDVASDAWYADAVAWLAANELTTGTAPGVYSPDATSTRAQIVTFLWRMAGQPDAGPFEPADCPRTFTAIGDSVMGGTRVDAHLTPSTFPGWVGSIDASGCRQPLEDMLLPSVCGQGPILSAVSVAAAAAAAGTLGEVVIIHTGTNGPFVDSTFDLLMAATERADTVWFVTIRTPWRQSEVTNATIRAGIERWDDTRDVRLLDWYAITGAAPELLDRVDHFHLTHLGRIAYAAMIGDALAAS